MSQAVLGIVFVLTVVFREYIIHEEHKSWAEERRELLNRIKPETAQIPNVSTSEILEPVRTDEDYWTAHENLLKEEGSYPYGFEEEVRGR